ncbi:MAG: hypothetical protein VYA51_12985 [Planctomycetota bacterium]|nr:hypothetical protein [Planctomycetota bacterium]
MKYTKEQLQAENARLRARWAELGEHVAWLRDKCRRDRVDAGAGVAMNIARKMTKLEAE